MTYMDYKKIRLKMLIFSKGKKEKGDKFIKFDKKENPFKSFIFKY